MGRLDFKWLTLGALRADPPPEVPFLWGSRDDGLLQERSFLMLHSSEKMGKSMFLLNLAVAGARADEEFLGIRLRPGGFKTLILQNEVHLRAVYERFTTMLRRGELTLEQAERVVINGYREVTLTNVILFALFKRKIKQWCPDLVGIDPLAHMLTEDENSNVAVGRGLAPLLRLRDDPGAAVCVIHHDSKVSENTSARPAQQRSRGANRLTADPDSIISLTPVKRSGGAPTARLSCSARYGRNLTPFRVRLNEQTFWFERYSEEQERGEQLQAMLREAGGRMPEPALVATAAEKWQSGDAQHGHRTVLKRIARAVADNMIYRHDLPTGVEYKCPPTLEE